MRREETGLAPRSAGSNRVRLTASSAAWSRAAWPEESRTTAETTLPVLSMNALIVTTPSHPALLALRGYAGSISPRGLGAEVVDPASPGSASPCAPAAPPGPPKRGVAASVPEPPEAGAAIGLAGPVEAPASPTTAGLSGALSRCDESGAVQSLAAEDGSR